MSNYTLTLTAEERMLLITALSTHLASLAKQAALNFPGDWQERVARSTQDANALFDRVLWAQRVNPQTASPSTPEPDSDQTATAPATHSSHDKGMI
jgi:hypothetical protein